MDEIMGCVSMLAQDQYGNYVVQHVLGHGKPHERSTIIQELAGNIVQMTQQKFASNVVGKCLTFGDPSERDLLVHEILGTTDENEPLQVLLMTLQNAPSGLEGQEIFKEYLKDEPWLKLLCKLNHCFLL